MPLPTYKNTFVSTVGSAGRQYTNKVRIQTKVFLYVVPSVMAAHLSVKQVGRVRFPGSTQCLGSLIVEHPPYKWKTAEHYRTEVPDKYVKQRSDL